MGEPQNRRRRGRPPPPANAGDAGLTPAEAAHAARLMRVNHAGEIAAQGLYHGQALAARSPTVRAELEKAALEEGDHLAWCEHRLAELNSRPSVLNPLWYAGSVAIGATMALAGDTVSLGFIAETEKQVEAHLGRHLADLPAADTQSLAIVDAMRGDEMRHGDMAREAGGVTLPYPVQLAMRAISRVMTFTAYRL